MIESSSQTKSIALLARVFTSCYRQGMRLTFIVLELDEKDGNVKLTCLGTDLLNGQKVQYTVPPNVWLGAFPTKDFHISTDGVVTKK
ncbi:ubiquinone biosynthesis protein COQ9 [Hibiscus syriacus]|uniref:Ubiquinone biosynthesis protein COQ9 n=1 Tax=Hibiscus syriacus TaxID=106335 RepID=A0A6A3C6S6_HIBSY|nr:ubiquinone biosynthesis protein COQ9 [Hibiscus syriacus]